MNEAREQTAQPAPVRRRLAGWLDRHRRWVLLMIVVLYAAGFSGRWRIGADSAEFARLGRALAAGEPYAGLLGRPPGSYPGLPWLLAANFRLFGHETLWPAILAVWLLGLAGLGLAYATLRLRLGRPAAVAITALCAVTVTFYQYSFELLADIPFATGFWMALLGYEEMNVRRGSRLWRGLALLVAGTAVMAAFRSAAMLFVAVLLLLMVVRLVRRPRRWRWGLVLAAVGVAVLLLRGFDARLDFPLGALPDESLVGKALIDRLGETVQSVLTERLPKLFSETLPEAVFGVELGPAGVPVAILLLVLVAWLLRVRLLWGLLGLAFIAEIALLTSTVSRYFIPLLPLMAAGWWIFAGWVERRLPRPHGQRVFVVLLVLWVAPNMVRVGDVVLEQHRGDFLAHYRHSKYAAVPELARAVRRHTPPNAVVVVDTDLSYELSYLSRRRVLLPRPRRREAIRKLVRVEPPFVLRSGTEADAQWIRRLCLRLGPRLATVPGREGRSWALHRARPVGRGSRPAR